MNRLVLFLILQSRYPITLSVKPNSMMKTKSYYSYIIHIFFSEVVKLEELRNMFYTNLND